MFVTHNVEKMAVYMAHRVVVMSAGPGRIVDVVDVAGEFPRVEAYRITGAFRETVERVSRLLARAGAA